MIAGMENITPAKPGAVEGRPEHEDRRDRRGYGPGPLVREITEDAGLRCWAKLPTGINTTGEFCGRPAVVEVYTKPYCETHGAEIKAAALLEMYFSASQELQLFDPEHVPEMDNRATMWVLRAGAAECTRRVGEAEEALDEALVAAYPFVEEHTDRETLAFDWSDAEGIGPPEEWYRTPLLHIHKVMRYAHEHDAVYILERLFELRQTTAAQLAFALHDAERKGHGRPNSKA